MSADVSGYYAALGVPASATASEIKSAYRRLAKMHHPDHSSSSSDDEIKRINEAYSILNNAENRAKYDSFCADSEVENPSTSTKIEPIRCSKCRKVATQPRYIIYWRVFSFLLATSKTPVQGFFCSACAKSEALKSTVITALLGWWGFPWGPIWTIGCGFRNALGGEQDQSRNDAVAWHNALAFIQMKQIAIAYGIADRLVNSKTQAIREAAGDFTALCRAQGLQSPGVLKDPWEAVRRQMPIRLAILASLPIILGIFIAINNPSNQRTSSPTYGNELVDHDAANQVAETQPEYAPTMPPIEVRPLCNNTPSNGTILEGKKRLVKEGHQLKIDNGSSGDAIVKIRNRTSHQLYAALFVQKGLSAELNGIADGDYEVQYAIGDSLAQDCKSFSGYFRASSFPQTGPFRAQYVNDYRGEGYIYRSLSYTLYSVPGGNVRPTSIDADSFNSP